MKGKLKGIVLPVIFFCVTLFISSAQAQSSQGTAQVTGQVTPQYMQTFAQTLIDAYINETNKYFPQTPSNLTFYSNASYNVTFYSSSQGGAGILFEPASAQSFETINTTDRIDTAIFGGNSIISAYLHAQNGTSAESVVLFYSEQGVIFNLDSQITPFMDFPYTNSSVDFRNLYLQRPNSTQAYYYVIVKSSNSTTHWTPKICSIEANYLLEMDTGQTLIPEIISSFEAIPNFNPIAEITSILENIRGNLTNLGYTPADYLSDLQKVQALAKRARNTMLPLTR